MWVSDGSGGMFKYRLFHPKPVLVRHGGHFSKAIHLVKIAYVFNNRVSLNTIQKDISLTFFK